MDTIIVISEPAPAVMLNPPACGAVILVVVDEPKKIEQPAIPIEAVRYEEVVSFTEFREFPSPTNCNSKNSVTRKAPIGRGRGPPWIMTAKLSFNPKHKTMNIEIRTDCSDFEPKVLKNDFGDCQTDGHYLCSGCRHIAPFELMEEGDNRVRYYPKQEKERQALEDYNEAMKQLQEEEREIADHNNNLLALIELKKGMPFFEELIEVIQDSEGIQGRAELVSEPVGTYQEEGGTEIPGIWVDQTTNGGHTGDTFAGTVCVMIGEGEYLKFQYSM